MTIKQCHKPFQIHLTPKTNVKIRADRSGVEYVVEVRRAIVHKDNWAGCEKLQNDLLTVPIDSIVEIDPYGNVVIIGKEK
jgi:hypothetical protein